MKYSQLPEGLYLVMDKGYTDYHQYAQWTDRGIFFVSRMKNNAKFESLEEIELPEDRDHEILKDETITVQYTVDKEKHPLKLRRIAYWDQKNQNCSSS
ncbi:transposase [Algoriphagus halophilus]|uniref:transposase n=1 Tax=Algoriphagus halophilus TaxID=226505 RepID=UPI00358F558C